MLPCTSYDMGNYKGTECTTPEYAALPCELSRAEDNRAQPTQEELSISPLNA